MTPGLGFEVGPHWWKASAGHAYCQRCLHAITQGRSSFGVRCKELYLSNTERHLLNTGI